MKPRLVARYPRLVAVINISFRLSENLFAYLYCPCYKFYGFCPSVMNSWITCMLLKGAFYQPQVWLHFKDIRELTFTYRVHPVTYRRYKYLNINSLHTVLEVVIP